MNYEIYIFGSTCRGDISQTSDTDVLAITFNNNKNDFPPSWSIYSSETIQEYYKQGRLFAWHLHLESKCIFSKRKKPFLKDLGKPSNYSTTKEDINDLSILLEQSLNELNSGTKNTIYELGLIYTSTRDIAMSASWPLTGSPNFSRLSPFELPIKFPVTIETYKKIMLARHSSTRGVELSFDTCKVLEEIKKAPIEKWAKEIRNLL